MAGRRPPSDLGSDWINVPRKFRGIKDTSSPTELAYITGAEKGLLSRFANANQVGPENIPSYDDSGFTMATEEKKKTKKNPFGYTGKYKTTGISTKTGTYDPKVRTPSTIYKDVTTQEKAQGQLGTSMRKAVQQADRYKQLKKGGPGKGGGKTDIMSGPEFGDTKKPWENGGDGGDDTTTKTTQGCGAGQESDGKGGCQPIGTTADADPCKGKDLTCPSDRPNGTGVCTNGNVDFSNCKKGPKTCPYGEDAQGNCKPNPDTGDEDADDGTPSLTTINQQVETPMLQTLTSDMDLRNMLSNVLNKNNPLFKQARTRALQAMAARGVVNSSLAEEAVMNAIMTVAMPIATRVIDDLQRVMAANVNASNAFKEALNEAYYKELQSRLDAANKWNLNRMLESGMNWRKMLEAKTAAGDISGKEQYERYMGMLGGQPGFNLGTPTYDVSGT